MDENLLNEAMNVQFSRDTKSVFGKVDVSVWPCALVKGLGKVPFDPEQHKPEDRQIAIDIYIEPLRTSRYQDLIFRKMIADSKEWAKIVMPSIKALGMSLSDLRGKWVRAEYVPTGRKYESQAGEEKEATTFKFVKIFSDEEEAVSAADALFSGTNKAGGVSPAGQSNGAPSVAGMSLETARTLLNALWRASAGDVNRFLVSLEKADQVKAHFPLTHPEVLALIEQSETVTA